MHQSHQRNGNVVEVFSGIQGEGLYVGCRQIFVRLCGCNLDCAFCDTPDARSAVSVCRFERVPGARDFVSLPNPVGLDRVISLVKSLDTPRGLHHSVVLTGGEPLLDIEWAASLVRAVRESGIRVMIETNGTLAANLERVLPWLDMISMDIKLPSTSGCVDLLAEHRDFIVAATNTELYVKIVVSSSTLAEEVVAAVRTVGEADRRIPVVLQPVTEHGGVRPPAPDQVLAWQSLCAEHVDDVRVIPQCHKILGQL